MSPPLLRLAWSFPRRNDHLGGLESLFGEQIVGKTDGQKAGTRGWTWETPLRTNAQMTYGPTA